MKNAKPIYIVSYLTYRDKKSFVGGIRPYKLYKFLSAQGYNAHLITPTSDTGEEMVIPEWKGLSLINSLTRALPPDRLLFWSLRVARSLRQQIGNRPGVVITSLPPHSLGLVGLWLKRWLPNIEWIVDFRDLWTKNTLYAPPLTKRFVDPIIERRYFDVADLVVLNTSWDLSHNRSLFPSIKDKSIFIRNGFDNLSESIFEERSTSFIYTGGTTAGQATVAVSTFLRDIHTEHGISFQCDFYGEYDDHMDQSAYINYKGKVEPDVVSKVLSNYKFGFIYLPVNSEGGGRVAQKFYDYLAAGVIPICFRASQEMNDMIQSLEVGISIPNEVNTAKILEAIVNSSFTVKPEKLEEYRREYQFTKLLPFLNK
ncbi:glycosyltransferase family 4 protein [Neolewinella litorea]|uniref:Glycosyltransferase subfamily 4-like N-terminal domain-containing protein n=1 Tax=Neolewinella litorea TaxID=2562452 RepID=A0A4S4N924_9BACT|nr:glycosyltransferase family 4 protein [Neolewinella litorea]THH34568.1 hypothetical protein E4021_17550 [Neolewinella litorea]